MLSAKPETPTDTHGRVEGPREDSLEAGWPYRGHRRAYGGMWRRIVIQPGHMRWEIITQPGHLRGCGDRGVGDQWL